MSINALRKSLDKFGEEVADAAKRNLGSQPRKSYRAKWKNGKLQSYQVTTKQRRINNTDTLRQSIDYKVIEKGDNTILQLSTIDYGVYVEEGRKPGKGIPPNVLKAWIDSKPIRVNTSETGFVKLSKETAEARKRTLGFLINRKIKTFGIEPVFFMKRAVDQFLPQLSDEIGEAKAVDIANQIKEKYGVRSISST